MIGLLRNWRLIALAGAVVALFASGVWSGPEWEKGRQARALAAQEAAWREAADKLRVSAQHQLQESADLRAKLDEVTNEILADPAGAAPALGVSDAERLNRIR